MKKTKKLFVAAALLLVCGIVHAQYFSGSQPGLPLLGKTSSIDGGALTNLSTTAISGTSLKTNTIIYVSNVSGITNGSGNVTNLTVTLATNTVIYIGQ